MDRLSRSLLDFGRVMGLFDKHGVSFVAVTQSINTADSAGRLMLNVLLSFAQYEKELIGERTSDKICAARRKGKWTGGHPVLGYDVDPEGAGLVVNETEASQVREIVRLYLDDPSLVRLAQELVHSAAGRLSRGSRRQETFTRELPSTGLICIGFCGILFTSAKCC